MNLPSFLHEVDKIAENLSEEQMATFIHEIARRLSETKREKFLDILKKMSEESKNICSNKEQNSINAELLSEIEENKNDLRKINEGEYCLKSEYNEEWDDWYNSNVDEILFLDPMHLLDKINKTIYLLHKCIDFEAYKEGRALVETLSNLEVIAEGDYEDYDGTPLGIRELYDHDLLDSNLENTLKECLYLVYMGNELQQRPRAIYAVIQNFQEYFVRLEEVFQMGECDLPQFKQFLTLWIEYLGEQDERRTKSLLKEAQLMLGDGQQALDIARQFADTHPELYEQILETNSNSDEAERMITVGLEALKKVKKCSEVRSRIALHTARYAYIIEKPEIYEYCWMEAFLSNPSIVNYMRVRFLVQDWSKYRERALQISGLVSRVQEIDYYMLQFLNQKFDRTMKEGLNATEPLGWSFTFMKDGIASFLLLLYERKTLPSGMKDMLNRMQYACGFTKQEFYYGTTITCEENDNELFWKLIYKWKKEVIISENDRQQWMMRISNLISLRVAGIMEANRRKYYDECASFIAALGEVQESLGETGAKMRVMRKYKELYPRRSAFIRELRNYGLKD